MAAPALCWLFTFYPSQHHGLIHSNEVSATAKTQRLHSSLLAPLRGCKTLEGRREANGPLTLFPWRLWPCFHRPRPASDLRSNLLSSFRVPTQGCLLLIQLSGAGFS